MGGLPPAGLQGVLGWLLGEVKPRLMWWISPKFKEPSTGMGPPLTGSPGRCTESEPEQCVEPDGGQHKRMLRQLARAHRMTERGSSIRCCCFCGQPWRVSGTPGAMRRQGHGTKALKDGVLRRLTSRVKPTAVQDSQK